MQQMKEQVRKLLLWASETCFLQLCLLQNGIGRPVGASGNSGDGEHPRNWKPRFHQAFTTVFALRGATGARMAILIISDNAYTHNM